MVNPTVINYEAFGAVFANSDDETQALFLKGLAAELRHWPSDHLKAMQGCSIATRLTKDEKKELEKMLEMIVYEGER